MCISMRPPRLIKMITFLLAKNYEVELLANVSETKRLHLYAKAQFFSIFLYIFFVRKPETHSSHSCQFLPRIVAFYAVSGTLAPPLIEPVQKKKSILMMIMTIKTVHSNNNGNSLPRGCSPLNSNSSSTTIAVWFIQSLTLDLNIIH